MVPKHGFTKHPPPSPALQSRPHSPLLYHRRFSWEAGKTSAAFTSQTRLDTATQTRTKNLREELARERRGIEEHVAELRRHGPRPVSRDLAHVQDGEEAVPGYGVDANENPALTRQIEYLLVEIERLRAAELALDDPPPAYV